MILKRLVAFAATNIFLIFILGIPLAPVYAQTGTLLSQSEIESSSFQTENGECAPGIESSRVIFYCNKSARLKTESFPTIPGSYRFDIQGASTNSALAGITLQLDGVTIGTVYFSGTSLSVQSVQVNLNSSPQSRQLKLILTTDNGQNDTIIDSYKLYYLGIPPTPLPLPSPPNTGSYQRGTYRNLFAETGKTSTEINSKLASAWNSLFSGDTNHTVYFPVGTDMAFIKDINNNDIRSEGQSYGMMIALQMNKQAEFEKLWKFAKTYMRCPHMANTQCPVADGHGGYFSWQVSANAPYSAIDVGAAPDGEEYFATALLFAAKRWNNADYAADAQAILDAMVNNNRSNGLTSAFNPTNHLVVFAPIGNAATMTDPSYHLPAFYEVWALLDTNASRRTFWAQAATASRAYWKNTSGYSAGRNNGLMPDCTNFSGVAVYGCAGGAIYAYDSWRTVANVAVDYAWWAKDPWQMTEVDNLQTFFGSRRPSYNNLWNLDGTSAGGSTNSPGQIAMNAVAGLAGRTNYVWDFANDLWNLEIPSGQYRYYDGMLYMMALLHVSGNFKIYASQSNVSPTILLTPVPGDANGDTKVDGGDYIVWVANFSQSTTSGSLSGDFDGNGIVNGADYMVWVAHFSAPN